MSGSKCVLVVDNDHSVHRVIGEIAARRGWRVEITCDGEEGWRRAAAEPFDLVVTGVDMRDSQGLDLLSRIRQERPALRVVVLTGASTAESVIRALREQAFAYFSKPLPVSALADAMYLAIEAEAEPADIQVLSAVPRWISLRVRARMGNADRVTQFLREAEVELDPNDRERIATAFRELLLNAIEHGSGADPHKWIWVSYVRTAREIVYYIRDQGEGFSLNGLNHAAVSHPAGSETDHVGVREKAGMRPGGFGLLLAQKLADEVIFNEKGNEVLLVKYLNGRD